MPRFVVLEHDHPTPHWDLMLQQGEVLRTWRLASPPAPGEPIPATASFDHRLLYLDYEGPVSGNRGTVRRWEAGTYTGELKEVPVGGEVRLHLCGGHLQGPAQLQRTGEQEWVFVCGGGNLERE